MLSALLIFRRLAIDALRVPGGGLRAVLGAAAAPILVRTFAYTFGQSRSAADGFYVAVATLTTSSVLDPKLAIPEPRLKIFTAFYVLVGIGILVEVARRLGLGFIASRDELAAMTGETD
jgi:hypothetical protein